MKTATTVLRRTRLRLLLLCLTLAVCAAVPALALDAEQKTVRVGWYESPFNHTDQFGRRSGYAYEYQQKIAAYTGWRYEYVEGTWPELYQMLVDGKIDLMSDVSYTEARTEQMLFPAQPMGYQSYYLCVSSRRDSGITADDPSSFNGKRVGINTGTVQYQMFLDWEAQNGVQAEVVNLMVNEDDSVEMLDKGEIDVFITVDAFGEIQKIVPLVKIGSSNFYFAVNKNRPDLLRELDSALNRILDENKTYNQKLQEKYINSTIVSVYFPQSEVDWLRAHNPIRVGYRRDYLPYCAQDPETGALTGAMADFLTMAQDTIKNGDIHLEGVPFDHMQDALDALHAGEVDCVFPVNFTDYDGEELGVLTTTAAMETEMHVVVRTDELQQFSLSQAQSAAVVRGEMNIGTFLLDHFPNWRQTEYETEADCLKAVADGAADCFLVSSYRLNRISEQMEQHRLSTLTTGRSMSLAFAVRRQDDSLYAILNKATNLVRDAAIDASLASWSYVKQPFTVLHFLRENLVDAIAVVLCVLALITALLLKSRYAERKARESLAALQESLAREEKQKKELHTTRKKAYTDPLTGVKSKTAYLEAVEAIQNRFDGGVPPEFAIAVFDVNDLKKVNDEQGHDAGDRHIRSACALICDVFKRSPIYRVGGDEFVAILEGQDYQSRLALMAAFNRTVEQNRRAGSVVVSAGCAAFDPDAGETYGDVFRRADEMMYERKRFLKGPGAEIR